MGARRYPEEIRRAVESERLVHRNITTDASIAQITAANVPTQFVLVEQGVAARLPGGYAAGLGTGCDGGRRGCPLRKVAVSLPNTEGTILVLPAEQIELVLGGLTRIEECQRGNGSCVKPAHGVLRQRYRDALRSLLVGPLGSLVGGAG